MAAANAALTQSSSQSAQPLLTRRDRGEEQGQMITIDRAIAGVFLALCVMVLKKIFYPAGTGLGTVDEFYLQRE